MKSNVVLSTKFIDKANDILIGKNKVFFSPESKGSNVEMVATILRNIQSIGFTFDVDSIEKLFGCSDQYLEAFYKDTSRALKKAVGANKKWDPMYPNFPKQVMEASEAELFINAIMHYLGDALGVRILPKYKKEKRAPLDENIKFKILSLGTVKDIENTVFNLMSANTSISETDQETIKWYISINPDFDLNKANISHKEVMSVVVSACLENNVDINKIMSIPKTVVDVIRIAVSISGGDISLAEDSKFITFPRKIRKMLMGMFNGLKYVDNDNLHTYRKKLIRLGEKLHPKEYASKYPQAGMMFHVVRNQKIESTIGKIEVAITNSKIDEAVSVLATRPGIFARKLDHILRLSSKKTVIEEFGSIVDSVATPVLLQVLNHFENRGSNRVAITNGKKPKIMLIEKHKKNISKNTIQEIKDIVNHSLERRFKKLKPMGNVFIDNALADYVVPFSQRSASKALKTVARGSRISMDPDKRYIRLFTWWKQPSDARVDIDLAAIALDSEFNIIDECSFSEMRKDYLTHSGDITSAPNGACEFIDIDREKIRKNVRYIMLSIFNFTEQSFSDLPECFAGVMFRKDNQDGEIFDARTVEHKFDVASEAKRCYPLIFDVVENKIIWTDLGSNGGDGYNTVLSNSEELRKACHSITTMKKFNLLDLLFMHANNRGTVVDKEEDADIVFSTKNGFQFEFDRIASEFLV